MLTPLLLLPSAPFVLLACGDQRTTPADADALDATDADTTRPPTMRIFGEVKRYGILRDDTDALEWQLLGKPAGASICLHGSTRCVESNADAVYSLTGVPADSQVAIVVSHADLMGPVVLPLVTGPDQKRLDLALVDRTAWASYLEGSGCALDPAPGLANLYLGLPPGASVTVSIGPAPPIYSGLDGFIDPALTAVPPGTRNDRAAAMVCGLPSGTALVDVIGATGDCGLVEGWPAEGHTAAVPLVADSWTVFNYLCD